MFRAGIAGLGRWGRILVDAVQGRSEEIRVTAGCTGRKERARHCCDHNGIDLRDSLDQLLADPSIDAIVLATPHSQHRDQIIASTATRSSPAPRPDHRLRRGGKTRLRGKALHPDEGGRRGRHLSL